MGRSLLRRGGRGAGVGPGVVERSGEGGWWWKVEPPTVY